MRFVQTGFISYSALFDSVTNNCLILIIVIGVVIVV